MILILTNVLSVKIDLSANLKTRISLLKYVISVKISLSANLFLGESPFGQL